MRARQQFGQDGKESELVLCSCHGLSLYISSFVCSVLQVQILLEGKGLQAKQPHERTQRTLISQGFFGEPQAQNKQLKTEI